MAISRQPDFFSTSSIKSKEIGQSKLWYLIMGTLKNSFQIQNYVYVEYGDRKSWLLTLVRCSWTSGKEPLVRNPCTLRSKLHECSLIRYTVVNSWYPKKALLHSKYLLELDLLEGIKMKKLLAVLVWRCRGPTRDLSLLSQSCFCISFFPIKQQW